MYPLESKYVLTASTIDRLVSPVNAIEKVVFNLLAILYAIDESSFCQGSLKS